MFGLGIGGSQSGSPSASRADRGDHGVQNRSSTSTDHDGKNQFVQKYLTNCKSFYSCIYCRTHLANHDELVSRSFQGNRGRAYLFNSVINISCGPSKKRLLNTGDHEVADIFCANCDTIMGWKYEKAYQESQKYKEGKYIIELVHVVRENRHLELDKRDMLVNNFQLQQQAIASSPSRGSYRCDMTKSSGAVGDNRSSLSPTDNNNGSIVAETTTTYPNANRWSTYSSSINQDNGNEVIIDDSIIEDELMFPLYDDLMQVDRSSYSGYGSSSMLLYNNNKARRSFYLDSTPYDWKYSTSSSSSADSGGSGASGDGAGGAGGAGGPSKSYQKSKAPPGSLASSVSSPSSSVSSASSVSRRNEHDNHLAKQTEVNLVVCLPSTSAIASNDCNTNIGQQSSAKLHDLQEASRKQQLEASNIIYRDDCQQSQRGDEETQFKFDAGSDTEDDNDADDDCNLFPGRTQTSGQMNKICDPTTSSKFSSKLENGATLTQKQLQPSPVTRPANGTHSSRTINATTTTKQLSQESSINLEDEEFFDCCTDHDVSN